MSAVARRVTPPSPVFIIFPSSSPPLLAEPFQTSAPRFFHDVFCVFCPHTGAMIAAKGVVLGLLLATGADGFVNPSVSRVSPLRQAELKLAPITSQQARFLSRSSFASGGVSCGASRKEGGSTRGGALSMRVINVGVIGAGRCGAMICAFFACMMLVCSVFVLYCRQDTPLGRGMSSGVQLH